MARLRQHRHHPHLRSPENAAGGQSDVQGGLLMPQPAQQNNNKIAAMQACIEHARALLESARAVQEVGHPNIAYHLAALTLEELGRRELIALQTITDTRPV